MSRTMSALSNVSAGTCGWCDHPSVPVVFVAEYQDENGSAGKWLCAACLFARTLAGAQITTGERECDNCSMQAAYCEEHAKNRCDSCDSDDSVYCYDCATGEWELHGSDDCDHGDCEYPSCEVCGSYPHGAMRCENHMPQTECSECGNTIEAGSERCTPCHLAFNGPNVITSEDGQSYQINGMNVEWN